MSATLQYQSGFGNEFASEAMPGALPVGQNSPQRVPYGLYAEQLSGTAFTAPRHQNRRSWLYRIRPAAMHAPFALLPEACFRNGFDEAPATPNALRWDPYAAAGCADRFRRRTGHLRRQWRRRGAGRRGHPPVCLQPLDAADVISAMPMASC